MPRLKKHVELALDVTNQTTSVNSGAFDGEPYDDVVVYTDVTAAASGTMIVSLDTSPDNGTTWYELDSGATLSSVTKERFAVSAPIGLLVRARTTLATSPDFTFTVRLEFSRRGE